jgi:hypothetical protein
LKKALDDGARARAGNGSAVAYDHRRRAEAQRAESGKEVLFLDYRRRWRYQRVQFLALPFLTRIGQKMAAMTDVTRRFRQAVT